MQTSPESDITASVVIVINNFNYGRFLNDSVRSALSQTHANTRVVVIDDGSTDESRQILTALQGVYEKLEIHYKGNGGQLSCFNAALPYIRGADWVFLLDADDQFAPNYVESMLAEATSETAMLLAEIKQYDIRLGEQPLADCRINTEPSIEIQRSAHMVAYLGLWLLRPTSALAVRGTLYRMILPYYPEEDWRICADEVVVFGASIVGGSKRFVRSIGINYRVHGHNNYHGTDPRAHSTRLRKPRIELIAALKKRAGLSLRGFWPHRAKPVMNESLSIPTHHRRVLNIPSPIHIAAWPLMWPVRKSRPLLGRTYRWLMSRHSCLYPVDQLIRAKLGKPPRTPTLHADAQQGNFSGKTGA